MSPTYIGKLSNATATCIAALTLFLVFPPHLKAQDPDPRDAPPATPTVHQEFLRKVREGELVSPGPAQKQSLKLAQIREDFRRIQTINAERIRPAITASSVDYRKIAKASSEIERRALRLRHNLALPDSAEVVQAAQDSLTSLDQMKRLDARIWSFVSNSIFRNSEVIDVHLAERASRDLREIINVSSWLKQKHD
jgi:hypothetical protein